MFQSLLFNMPGTLAGQMSSLYTRPPLCMGVAVIRRKGSDGLFLHAARKASEKYPDIAMVDMSLDKACLQV